MCSIDFNIESKRQLCTMITRFGSISDIPLSVFGFRFPFKMYRSRSLSTRRTFVVKTNPTFQSTLFFSALKGIFRKIRRTAGRMRVTRTGEIKSPRAIRSLSFHSKFRKIHPSPKFAVQSSPLLDRCNNVPGHPRAEIYFL